MFGATADGVHYNVFSSPAKAFANRMMGIPLICFFDDFAALAPQILASKALGVCDFFCSPLRIHLESIKAEVCNVVTFLGLRGCYQRRGDSYRLNIPLPTENGTHGRPFGAITSEDDRLPSRNSKS